jgi:Ni,Fe-hydrogenase I small subunit
MRHQRNDTQRKLRLLWLQSGGCGGCTMSLLGAEAPDFLTAFNAAGIEILWHPSLSATGGKDLVGILERIEQGSETLDILCLEGAVMCGPNGTGKFHIMSGTGRPAMEWLSILSRCADYVVAVGSCAAFGGISAGCGNHVEAVGLAYDGTEAGGLLGPDFRSKAGLPVINVAGCPIHPGWLTETLYTIAEGTCDLKDLDEWDRPLSYTAHLVHHGCARNEFYEYKASAERLCDRGCMMENLGCKGTQARADCNIRAWNGGGSCLDGNFPCINCTAPGFEEPGHIFTTTPKVAGIPVGLPTDMPKAWFVALASLSKAATPARLRDNATADTFITVPVDRRKRKS